MRHLFLSLLFILSWSVSYGQITKALSEGDFAQREITLDSLFHTRSIVYQEIADSASFYNRVNVWLKIAKEEDNRNLYEHLLLERLRYQLKNTKVTVTPDQLNDFIRQFRAKDKKYFIPSAQHAYANSLSVKKQNQELGLELYIKAYYSYENFSLEEFPYKAAMIYDIAAAYYRFNDFSNTIKYISLAIDRKDTCYCHNLDIVNILALSYREIGQFDSALFYFNKIRNNSKQGVWEDISMLNIGQTCLLQKKYVQAKNVFEACFHKAQKERINHMIGEAGLALGRIAVAQGRYGDAEAVVDTVINIWRNKFGHLWHYERLESAEFAYKLLAEIYERKGDYKLAYLYRDTFLMMRDSINSNYNALKLSNAQNNVQLARFEQEMQRVAYERKQNTLIRNILLVFIFLSAVITLLFINNQKLKRRQLEAEKLNAEDKLQDFMKTLHQKTQLIDQFASELEQYKVKEYTEEYNETLFKLQQSTILTDEEWVNFRNMFEQVHKGFLHRLKAKLPDLTPAEIRFMVLSKLKFSPKDMANILGVGPSAIRKYRYRLRNKLSMPEDGSIDEVVDMI